MPPSEPPSGKTSDTMGRPSEPYSSGELVTTRQSGRTAATVSTMCRISGRPPKGIRAFGDPPIRRLRPPASTTPLT